MKTTTLPRTVVTMIYAGPDGSAYGIYRAKVRFKTPSRWTWNAHKATQIGVVRLGASMGSPDYTAMASQFATTEWPAMQYEIHG